MRKILICFLFLLFNLKGAVVINEFLAANASTNIDPYFKQFSDWIELYNTEPVEVNISGYYLTDDITELKWQIPDGTVIPGNGFLIFWADGEDAYNHTNFTLNMDGEEIALIDPSGEIVDYIVFGQQAPDVSYGRKPDGSDNWYYSGKPTPKSPNTTEGVGDIIFSETVNFSPTGGFYNNSISVSLSTASGDAEIRYTTDGSIPDETSTLYTGPIVVNETTVIKARSFKSGYLPSPVSTQTYFINENISLPVISISTNPEYFFDDEIGIYVFGNDYDPNPPYYGANFWWDWERPVNVEYYDQDKNQCFNVLCGVKIFGGISRAVPEKSLALYTKDKYNLNSFHYKFFPEKNVDKFKRIILRNSGQDWPLTMFRDALSQSLLIGQMDIDYQGYSPSIVFINGQYWGIHNIREKVDQYYPEDNYGISHNNIDMLEHGEDIHVIAGDRTDYDSMVAFMEANDMRLPENYEVIKSKIDIDEFINYIIAEIYLANVDWPGVNCRFWREKNPPGKYRFIIYDTDFGFGLYGLALGVDPYNWNMIEQATDPDGPAWPNPPNSTFLIRKLLENSEFKSEFIQRTAAYLNTTFKTERVLNMIEQVKSKIQPEISRHIEKWGGLFDGFIGFTSFNSIEEWESNIEVMREFARRRPEIVRQHFVDHFSLSGTSQLSINVSPSGAGKVLTAGVEVPENFTGIYFKDIPLRLNAVPYPGYRFLRWEGDIKSTDEEISIVLDGNKSITAVFEYTGPVNVVINEIHYNPSPLQGDDEIYEFIELYNAGENTVDLSGYHFTEGITFTFPDGTIIQPGEYIVVACTSSTYQGRGYQVFQWSAGRLDNAGETITLADRYGNVIDTVTYGDAFPWPSEPDGNGPSLSLINPSSDNSQPENWKSSFIVGGTPGRYNWAGDVNKDGFVDISDVILCLRMVIGLCVSIGGEDYCSPYPEELILPADINGDGFVDISDVILTLRIAIGLE